ncbi:hypothetical protein [Streptosporangium minutum]|uniref:Uncharacterized protein n=1 Tax=Streptosporangium minutum TaxID=569862 RepID=A0A243RLL8_9ACTN|nr:hypothetical protein [Streptosporangium minutum]OUC95134.1 hypothetical protein CA984_19875 [Streptosporangium minutum]
MFGEIVARYAELIDLMTWESVAYTVTIPDYGVLTVEDAVCRLGFDAAAMRAPGEAQPDDLAIQQVGTGIVTWSNNPCDDSREVTNRLGGEGFRHWYLAGDIEGNTTMYVRYGDSDGQLDFPEPGWTPFTAWTDHLGPLAPYAGTFAVVYDTWEDDLEMCIEGTCLAVIELESGVRLDTGLWNGSKTYLPMSR